MGYSTSLISHINTFLSDFVSFQTASTASLSIISKSVIFLPFFKLLECLVLGFHFAFNLFIYPWWISVTNCNDLTSYKVWKNIEQWVIKYIFQHLHWKTIYSNRCLKCFGLSLDWHFCNPKQVFGKGGGYIICWLNLAHVIWWWQFSWSDGLILLFITWLGWSVKMRSMQDDEFWRMCVGSNINWEKPYCELMD